MMVNLLVMRFGSGLLGFVCLSLLLDLFGVGLSLVMFFSRSFLFYLPLFRFALLLWLRCDLLLGLLSKVRRRA